MYEKGCFGSKSAVLTKIDHLYITLQRGSKSNIQVSKV